MPRLVTRARAMLRVSRADGWVAWGTALLRVPWIWLPFERLTYLPSGPSRQLRDALTSGDNLGSGMRRIAQAEGRSWNKQTLPTMGTGSLPEPSIEAESEEEIPDEEVEIPLSAQECSWSLGVMLRSPGAYS